MDNNHIIPIICGPTGSGKTAIAVSLAENHPIEVISADSRQIIRHLNIGTAKPTAEEQQRIRFHLLDLIEPGDRYSAFRFVEDANRAIRDARDRDGVPLVVGGTGLYLRALSDGVVEIEPEDMQLRERLEKEMDEIGCDALHQRLEKIDPLEATRIHPNNRMRILRALEIFYLTGKTKSELVATGAYKRSDFSFQYYCLAPKREELYRRINDRVDQMIASGLVEELEQLVNRDMKERIRKANVIGYAELLDFLDGKLTMEDAIALIKQNSRRYAKRQMTWFRHQSHCQFYLDADSLRKSITLG